MEKASWRTSLFELAVSRVCPLPGRTSALVFREKLMSCIILLIAADTPTSGQYLEPNLGNEV